MKPPVAPLLLLVPPLLFAAVLRSQPPEQAPPPRAVEGGFFPASRFQLQGVNSCAAAACHNNGAPPGVAGGEYSTWIDKDKHARAYEVLFSQRSRYIDKNLRRLASIDQAHPETNAYCLKCHVHPHADQKPVLDGGKIFQDGVSCEACHGPAEKWLSIHFHDSWKQKTPGEKKAWGMYDTKSIAGRARLCIDCHVGTPGNDANHDLFAAGHPRLAFEFAAFHANMPRHWNDARDKNPAVDARGKADFEARAWLIGQALTAQAALKLLAHRAAYKELPWPEFAEYDCYACHHDLKGSSRHEKGRLPGSLPWQSWYTSMVGRASPRPDEDGEQLAKLLQTIRLEMERPAPRREAVAENAKKAAQLLQPWAAKLDQAVAVPEMFWEIVRRDTVNATRDWDHASQVFNALGALHNAWADIERHASPAGENVRRQLVEFGRQLPAVFPYESPSTFDADSIKRPLLELRKAAPR